MLFGDIFKELRINTGLNQEEFIKDFNKKYNYNFTKSAVSQYENNKRIPEIDALIAFSKYFGVSIDYLFGNTAQQEDLQNNIKIPDEYTKIFDILNACKISEKINEGNKDVFYELISNACNLFDTINNKIK